VYFVHILTVSHVIYFGGLFEAFNFNNMLIKYNILLTEITYVVTFTKI